MNDLLLFAFMWLASGYLTSAAYVPGREALPVLHPVGHWFTEWGTWGTCTGECGTGIRTRTRECDSHLAHGFMCEDHFLNDYEECFLSPCPVNGAWGSWSPFGPCSESCGLGVKSRYRFCNNPAKSNGGRDCVGSQNEDANCYLRSCTTGGMCDNNNDNCDVWASLGFCRDGIVKRSCPKACGTCKPSGPA